MIHYVKGDLLDSSADALVNTVNTVGVMGKGIALQFKEAYPENYRVYKNACQNKEFHIGDILIVEDHNLVTGRKLIVNFPTKTHWKMPSDYSYIQQGLMTLRREIENRHIQSIAIPPLGSHNGGLDWLVVKRMIEETLAGLECDIYLYEPSDVIIERLKTERVKLTPARAMLLSMFGDMNKNGEFASVFAAEKIIYFMQRFGAKDLFKIDFKPYYYGPYSGGKVAHVLYHMNGSYIKGMGGMKSRPFDYIWLIDGAEQEANDFINSYKDNKLRKICTKTMGFLQGCYSNYTLELLSSVDYLLQTVPGLENWKNDDPNTVLDTLEYEIQNWSKRKEQMFKRTLLLDAVNYLKDSV
jgi:O-acetyl-ADP-ribose deacetylase (regulator of RNase III)